MIYHFDFQIAATPNAGLGTPRNNENAAQTPGGFTPAPQTPGGAGAAGATPMRDSLSINQDSTFGFVVQMKFTNLRT